MPWCEQCDRYRATGTLGDDGSCPDCGQVLAAPAAPWHFKLLLVAVVLYLGYRAWQGLAWLSHHL